MKRPHTNPLRALGMSFGLALAVAGCGDDSTGTTTGDTSNTVSTGGSGGSGSTASTGGSGGTVSTGGSGGSSSTESTGGTGGGETKSLGFFVSSTGSTTANLGGIAGADKRCQDLAEVAGAGAKTWRAYLSIEKDANDQPVHAKDRIGTGPWYNAKLELVAAGLTELHERFGDPEVFLDEKGEKVPGQWEGSPTPNQHDVLTGTQRDGTLQPGKTCADWTSADAAMTAQVGHSDGLGPNMSMADNYRPWNSVHESGSCADTAPKGGNGRVYCFATN